MTPDEALQSMRNALSVLMPIRARIIKIAPDAYKRDEIDELIDAAAALDVWLSKGGWLPAAWEPTDAHIEEAAARFNRAVSFLDTVLEQHDRKTYITFVGGGGAAPELVPTGGTGSNGRGRP